tara:strand:+ start:1433 stop:2062 length:630 start_codon:yes stop_codon:yes gene_type:complete
MGAPRRKHGTAKTAQGFPSADMILDRALALAGDAGWDRFSLSALAADLGLSPADLADHFRDKDALANAWFTRARAAMLAAPPRGFARQLVRDRLNILLLRWFDALSPHHRVTAQMLKGKLWPFHPHHYVPMVFDLSRLIQWLRDAAGMTAGGRQRQMEEIGLTLLFLAVLRRWCRDGSPGQAETRAYLARRLDQADTCAGRWFRNTRGA